MKGRKHLCRHHPPAEPTYLAGQESPLWGCLVTGHLVIVGPQNWQYRFGKTVWNVHNLLKTSTQVCTMFPLLWSLTTNILFDNTYRRFSLVLLYTFKCSKLFTTVQCNYSRDCKITHLLHTLQLHTFTQLHTLQLRKSKEPILTNGNESYIKLSSAKKVYLMQRII